MYDGDIYCFYGYSGCDFMEINENLILKEINKFKIKHQQIITLLKTNHIKFKIKFGYFMNYE